MNKAPKRNQLNITRSEINHLAQVFDQDKADDIRNMDRYYRETGGMTPNAATAIRDELGKLDEESLLDMLGNFTIWRSQFLD